MNIRVIYCILGTGESRREVEPCTAITAVRWLIGADVAFVRLAAVEWKYWPRRGSCHMDDILANCVKLEEAALKSSEPTINPVKYRVSSFNTE